MRNTVMRISVALIAVAMATLSAAACCSVGAAAVQPFVGDVTIAEDGSVLPTKAPVRLVDGVYVFKRDIDGTVCVLKDGATVDGNGYSLVDTDATEWDVGLKLDGVSNVVLRNLDVSGYTVSVDLMNCRDCVIANSHFEGGVNCMQVGSSANTRVVGNTVSSFESWAIMISNGAGVDVVSDNVVTDAGFGVYIHCCQQANVERNVVSRCTYGITLAASFDSANNLVSQNIVSCGPYSIGIFITGILDTRIEGNELQNNGNGIWGFGATRCEITGNEFAGGDIGVLLENSLDCRTFGNDFVRNKVHAVCDLGSAGNVWDDGTRGNYWSQYDGVDLDLDGIGDTPYVIDEDDMDRYPLMGPVS